MRKTSYTDSAPRCTCPKADPFTPGSAVRGFVHSESCPVTRYIREQFAKSGDSAHRIVDARNKFVESGYLCIDCGAVFAAVHTSAAPAQSAEPAANDPDRVLQSELWQLVDYARAWEKAYLDSGTLYGSLDSYKSEVETQIRHVQNRVKDLYTAPQPSLPAQAVGHGLNGIPRDANGLPLIQDPVSKLDEMLVTARLYRFRNDTYDALDVLDAALFSGDEFFDGLARNALRYYMARWEKKLRENDEFDKESENG